METYGCIFLSDPRVGDHVMNEVRCVQLVSGGYTRQGLPYMIDCSLFTDLESLNYSSVRVRYIPREGLACAYSDMNCVGLLEVGSPGEKHACQESIPSGYHQSGIRITFQHCVRGRPFISPLT